MVEIHFRSVGKIFLLRSLIEHKFCKRLKSFSITKGFVSGQSGWLCLRLYKPIVGLFKLMLKTFDIKR